MFEYLAVMASIDYLAYGEFIPSLIVVLITLFVMDYGIPKDRLYLWLAMGAWDMD